jgi:hypothetical protein
MTKLVKETNEYLESVIKDHYKHNNYDLTYFDCCHIAYDIYPNYMINAIELHYALLHDDKDYKDYVNLYMQIEKIEKLKLDYYNDFDYNHYGIVKNAVIKYYTRMLDFYNRKIQGGC